MWAADDRSSDRRLSTLANDRWLRSGTILTFANRESLVWVVHPGVERVGVNVLLCARVGLANVAKSPKRE